MSEITLPFLYTPRDYQLPILKAWDSGVKRLFWVAHRRCLHGDTLIAMSDGTYKKIKDVSVGDSVLSYFNKRLVNKKVLNVFDNGIKDVGYYNNLISTDNHEVLTRIDNRETYHEIGKASHLVYAGELSFGSYHNPELAELLGLLLTDGSIKINQTPKFTNIDEKLLSRFEYLIGTQFPEIETKRYAKGKGFDITYATKIKTNYHPIRKYFETSNTLPKIVWTFDRESTLAFISGLISGDGSISFKKTKSPNGFTGLTGSLVVEAGISEELAHEYSKLLLKFGIHSKITKDKRGNNNRVYCYSLSELHNLSGIKIQSAHKQERFDYVLANVKKVNQIRRVSIKKSNYISSARVYDIEVEDTHNYVANGYIVHNCGKDKTIFANIPKKMMERVGTYYYFLPTYSQAKKVIWTGADGSGLRFLEHFPKALIKEKNEADMRIELINGSILQLVGADNIDRIVGTNPVGVVFSEYSLMKEEVWNFISPILAENGGWAVFIMTPRGMNHAYDLMQRVKESKDWFVEVLGVDKTKALSDEVLADQRIQMPEDVFNQEYYCKFIEGGTGFFKRVSENTYDPSEYKPKEFATYQIGVDLAKYNDFTVITPFNLNDFHVLKQDRFNQIDYNLQKARIENAYLRFNKGKIMIDSTGVGEPVYDDLYSRGINIDPFRFNERTRMDLLKNLQMLLEQDKIKIPNDEKLLDELRSAQYDITPTGKVTIKVPDNKHDDMIMSLALAVWQIPPQPIHTNMFTRGFQPKGVEPMYPEFGI